MQRIGGYLIFFAIASAILSQTNYQFRILFWMEQMGSGAWLVRGMMLALGAFLLFGNQAVQRHPEPARVRASAPRPTWPVHPPTDEP